MNFFSPLPYNTNLEYGVPEPGVYGGEWVVHHVDRTGLVDGPGQANPLSLAAAQVFPAPLHPRLVALGETPEVLLSERERNDIIIDDQAIRQKPHQINFKVYVQKNTPKTYFCRSACSTHE